MPVSIVVGAQWGDEGKGKIVDVLAQTADVAVRFNGGNNAGHTVINEDGQYALHLISAGIFNHQTICIIERGVVVHPPSLMEEMKLLLNRGISLKGLKISPSAHIVMPWHIAEDQGKESGVAIGTTLRGIGPCYQDKVGRWFAIRIEDMQDKQLFFGILETTYAAKKQELHAKFPDGNIRLPDFETIRTSYLEAREYILPYIANTTSLIRRALAKKKHVLLEGAQGTLLDVDYGSYPYVTSSNTVSMAACLLTGVPFREVRAIIGVAKAYLTRVGGGPFPTEIDGPEQNMLREAGREYGATTGRPRRCGWMDLPLLRYACMVNDLTEIALTKMDILGLLDTIKICNSYKGLNREEGLADLRNLDAKTPEYITTQGWGSLEGCRFRSELPELAQNYIKKIEAYTGVRVHYISIGGKRKEIIAL